MNIYTKMVFGLTALTLAATTISASATTIHLEGTTVDFYYDDAQPGMAAYGELTVVGDSIFAAPTDFFAEASGTAGSDAFSALGTVTIVAKPGYAFDTVAVQQIGDYRLVGPGSSVDSIGDLSITETGNVSTSESQVMVTSGFGVNDGTLTEWSSQGFFDMSTSTWLGVNSVELSLDSLLTAQSTADNELAFIQNKMIGGGLVTVETTVIPLPAASWLFATGLLCLIRAGRKRSFK